MTGRALFVSPHLDDAVFSAGAIAARLAAARWHVTVATVFTASVPAPQGFALACQTDKGIGPEVDYMALRRAEDAAALREIGAEALWLGLPEAPHRGYGSPDRLFAEVRADDPARTGVPGAVRGALEAVRPDIVLAPAGIGGHVDHLLVRAAVEAAGPAGLLLWRDQPYAHRNAVPPAPGETAIDAGAMLGRKIAAAARYASQLGFQYGGAAAMARAIGAAARADAAGSPHHAAERVTGAVGLLLAALGSGTAAGASVGARAGATGHA